MVSGPTGCYKEQELYTLYQEHWICGVYSWQIRQYSAGCATLLVFNDQSLGRFSLVSMMSVCPHVCASDVPFTCHFLHRSFSAWVNFSLSLEVRATLGGESNHQRWKPTSEMRDCLQIMWAIFSLDPPSPLCQRLSAIGFPPPPFVSDVSIWLPDTIGNQI